MKINRFVAMAAIALLAIGAMGAISMKVLAKGSQAPITQSNCNVAIRTKPMERKALTPPIPTMSRKKLAIKAVQITAWKHPKSRLLLPRNIYLLFIKTPPVLRGRLLLITSSQLHLFILY
jgi:hypothetical protein